ncbi:DUF6332 family protein [Actinacidiphila alni]|uniref:DUF6332 family protein n=1 Tax=Actinacidiphila alni TaxID=380248 RepID=UPI0034520EDB
MRSSRTRAERDATTVEMVFAAVTGAVLAAAAFLAVASPVMADQAHGTAREGWFTAAVIVAAAAFCGRVAVTLRRFERRGRPRGQLPEPDGDEFLDTAARSAAESGTGPGEGAVFPAQPSQPGRTSPDS